MTLPTEMEVDEQAPRNLYEIIMHIRMHDGMNLDHKLIENHETATVYDYLIAFKILVSRQLEKKAEHELLI